MVTVIIVILLVMHFFPFVFFYFFGKFRIKGSVLSHVRIKENKLSLTALMIWNLSLFFWIKNDLESIRRGLIHRNK